VLGKRRFKKATKGITVPVMAITLRKKNSQRGPSSGGVRMKRATNPPQPVMIKNKAEGI
jgi:hypothetical protein